MANTDVGLNIKRVENPNVLMTGSESLRKARVNDELLSSIKKYYESNPINPLESRDRIFDLSLQLEGIKPIDLRGISDLVVERNYAERGMVIKMSLNSLKQAWLEYRLIYNENNERKREEPKYEIKKEKREEVHVMDDMEKDSYVLNNFDELFDKLSQKVSNTGKYIDDLEQLRREATSSNQALEESRKSFEKDKLSFEDVMQAERDKIETLREQFEQEKREFEQKKKEELRKIQEEKLKLSEHYERLQRLTEEFNNKISKIA